MKKSNKVLAGVGLGMIAGSAIGYFLKTDGGQKFTQKTLTTLKDIQSDVKDKVAVGSENVIATVESTTTKAKDLANSIADVTKDAISNTANSAKDIVLATENNIEVGADKAKRTVKKKVNKVSKSKSVKK